MSLQNFQKSFLLRVVGLFLVWLLLVSNFLNFYDVFNEALLDLIQDSSLLLIDFVGFETFSQGRNFGIENSSGVILGAPCDGLSLMYLYMSFIVAVPGKWKTKLFWIVAGIIGIQVLNVIRVISLIIIVVYRPSLLSFNHDYTFTFLIYTLIFVSWIFYFRYNNYLEKV